MSKEGNFTLNIKNNVKYYTIPDFQRTGLVKHMFSTRVKGLSQPPFDSLNLSINREDDTEAVKGNFKIVCDILGISMDSLVFSNQVHGTNISIIDEKNRENIFKIDRFQEGVDGLLTNTRGISLCTFYADCVPMFFLDPTKKVIGLAHGGWRGTVNKIAEKMIDRMEEVYSCNVGDILVGVGPSIGPCCYEVGEEVFNKFNNIFTNTSNLLKSTGSNKWHLNLWQANVVILNKRGIPLKNITVSELCTSCNNDIFYSYRKENGKTGRMAAIIQLV